MKVGIVFATVAFGSRFRAFGLAIFEVDVPLDDGCEYAVSGGGERLGEMISHDLHTIMLCFVMCHGIFVTTCRTSDSVSCHDYCVSCHGIRKDPELVSPARE